jgi:hypothetical protein
MLTKLARVFALGLGLGLAAGLGIGVVLAGATSFDEQQITRRVEATATATRQQAQTRARATAVARATATIERDARASALCARQRGALVDASLIGEPGISHAAYAAAGTVRNLCAHPVEVTLYVLVLTRDGQVIDDLVDARPFRLEPGERRAFSYPLGRFPNGYLADLDFVPITREP